MRRLAMIALAVLAALPGIAAAQSRTVWSGVFTETQAARGAVTYGQHCARCHGTSLAGSYDTPSLKGRMIANWSGATLDGLFGYIANAMPIHAPGALPPQANADILAYLLKANGFPAAKGELEPSPAALKQVTITGRPPPAR